MERLSLHPILVISADWRTRALLAAQLGETTGHDVVPAPGVSQALGLIRLAGIKPSLLIIDTGQDIGSEEVEQLVETLPETTAILVGSGLRRREFDSLGKRCAAYLVRPVTIGKIAETAEAVLRAQPGSHTGAAPTLPG